MSRLEVTAVPLSVAQDVARRTAERATRTAEIVELLRPPVDASVRRLVAPGGPSTVLIQGLPLDDRVAPTPSSKAGAEVSTPAADHMALALAQLVGNAYTYVAESPTVVQNVWPERARSGERTSSGSSTPLGFHTDLDYFADRPNGPYNVTNPDIIVLLCLRSDPRQEAETLYADARDLVAGLRPRIVQTLRQEVFRLPTSYSFNPVDVSVRPWSMPTSLLYDRHGRTEIAADLLPGAPTAADPPPCLQGALTPTAAEALADLRAALALGRVPVTSVTLHAGEALLMDNRHGLHARTSFQASHDGSDRWLKRVYARQDLTPLGHYVGTLVQIAP